MEWLEVVAIEKSLAFGSPVPALRKMREERGTRGVVASAIKSLGQSPVEKSLAFGSSVPALAKKRKDGAPAVRWRRRRTKAWAIRQFCSRPCKKTQGRGTHGVVASATSKAWATRRWVKERSSRQFPRCPARPHW